jgi:hypothetical protein
MFLAKLDLLRLRRFQRSILRVFYVGLSKSIRSALTQHLENWDLSRLVAMQNIVRKFSE